MTLQDMSQVYYLRQAIDRDRERLRALRSAALPGAQVITGMPHASGVSDNVGRYAADIADLQLAIDANMQRYRLARLRIEHYIDQMPDRLLREICRLRFLRLMSWPAVAAHIGGGSTADSVRMICTRYFSVRRCDECGRVLEGRVDQRFCDDLCRFRASQRKF